MQIADIALSSSLSIEWHHCEGQFLISRTENNLLFKKIHQDVLLKTTERDSTANDVLELRQMLDRYMELMQEIVQDAPNAAIRGEGFVSIADLLIFFGRRNNLVKNPVLAPMVYQVKINPSSS